MQTNSRGHSSDYEDNAVSLADVRGVAGYAVLEFGAPWCGHCKAAQPAIKQVMKSCANLPYFKIYDGKGKPLGRTFGVKQWPTLILVKGGEEVARLVRPLSPGEVRKLLEVCIDDL